MRDGSYEVRWCLIVVKQRCIWQMCGYKPTCVRLPWRTYVLEKHEKQHQACVINSSSSTNYRPPIFDETSSYIYCLRLSQTRVRGGWCGRVATSGSNIRKSATVFHIENNFEEKESLMARGGRWCILGKRGYWPRPSCVYSYSRVWLMEYIFQGLI